jgi:hypothetical protein
MRERLEQQRLDRLFQAQRARESAIEAQLRQQAMWRAELRAEQMWQARMERRAYQDWLRRQRTRDLMMWRQAQYDGWQQPSVVYLVGQPLPAAYADYNVPHRYRDDYYDNADYAYRYDDRADSIYQVDRRSGLIESVISLLPGLFNIGQAMPAGYDAYNLPFEYRGLYQDDQDWMYRYDGRDVYQVDARTGIVEAIVGALGSQFGIGQPLPSGFDAYNLPWQYRDRYVDNDDYLYRYSEGDIYQVDAETGLIEAILPTLFG